MLYYFEIFIIFILISIFYISVIHINRKNTKNNIKENNNTSFLSNTIIIILILFVGICVSNKYFQNDTFFTIALGEETLQNGVHNREVLTYHQNFKYYNIRWLFNVVISLINSHFGFNGIYIFVILITVLTAFSLYYCLNKLTNKKIISFLITCIAMYFSRSYFVARAQIISILIFIIEYYSILMFAKSGKKKYMLILLILPIIIVNFHASLFPFYIILYLPILIEHILSKFIKNSSCLNFDRIKNIKYFCLVLIINILEGVLSPIGFSSYWVMFSALGGISKKMILELQPLTNDSYSLYLITYFILFLYNYVFSKKKIKAHTLFLLVGLAIIGIISIRNLLLFYIIGAFSLGEVAQIFFDENSNLNINSTKKIILLQSFIIVTILVVFGINFKKNISFDYVDNTYYPVEATEYLLKNVNLSNYTLYNGFNYGSYLEYKGIKTFMDSRSEVYEKNYNNTDILEDYSNLCYNYKKHLDYKEFFDKYNIDLALIKKDSDEESFYNTQIKKDIHHCLNTIYEDNYFMLCEVK